MNSRAVLLGLVSLYVVVLTIQLTTGRIGTWGRNISRDKQPVRFNFFVWLLLLVSLLVFAVFLKVVRK